MDHFDGSGNSPPTPGVEAFSLPSVTVLVPSEVSTLPGPHGERRYQAPRSSTNVAPNNALHSARTGRLDPLDPASRHQSERLSSFLYQGTPGSANSTLQYNLTQSKLAIVSGGFTGKGLFHGAMTNLCYVPQQQTDFIFSAVGEQFGFVGGAATLGRYSLIV